MVGAMRLSDLARTLSDVARAILAPPRRSRGGSRPSQPRSVPTKRETSDRGVAEYDPDRSGPPRFSYQPEQDGEPDPGEVVWGWVPYEEDATQGKDRPLLIVGTADGAFVAVQLTSKDRAEDGAIRREHGRVWLDVGTGAWDRKRRPSEARLDRLLRVKTSAIRREGAALPPDRFRQVVAALGEVHGW